MKKEDRLIFLTSLTLVIYAFSIYFSHDAFLFPIPLNAFILFVVGFQFFWWNKSQGFPALLVLLIGMLSLLGSQVFWSMFLSDEAMQSMMDSYLIDLFAIMAYFCILLFAISQTLRQKTVLSLVLSSLFAIFFLYGEIFQYPLIVLASFGLMIFSNIHKAVFQPLHLIWILLFILKGSELISYLLN